MRAAAQRAVELDLQLGDGHAMLGLVAYWYDWDWPPAEQTMRCARALNPSSVDAHSGLAHVLMTTGRQAEALPLFTRAREIDPHSPPVNCFEGGMLAMSGQRATVSPGSNIRSASTPPSASRACSSATC